MYASEDDWVDAAGFELVDCCFPLCLVGSPRDLTAFFRRRISWDDGAIRDISDRSDPRLGPLDTQHTVLDGAPEDRFAAGWRLRRCARVRTAGATRSVSRGRRPSLRAGSAGGGAIVTRPARRCELRYGVLRPLRIARSALSLAGWSACPGTRRRACAPSPRSTVRVRPRCADDCGLCAPHHPGRTEPVHRVQLDHAR